MAVRKNWFFYLTLFLFELFSFYALYSLAIDRAQKRGLGSVLVFVFVMAAVLFLIASLRRRKATERLTRSLRIDSVPEAAVVIILMLLGIFLRLAAIRRFPVLPNSDYGTYYRAAVLLTRGRLKGSPIAVYISAYPHVFGYPFVLSLLFRLTGPSLDAGLLLNLCASILAAFFAYRAARLLGGRLCGLLTLAAGVLWPSQILYGTLLASEPIFTCALMLMLLLFIRLRQAEGGRRIWLCILLGALTALAGAIRPMALIMLIAMIAYLLFSNKDRRRGNGTGGPLAVFGRNWAQALIMLLVYLLCARPIAAGVTRAVGRPLASSGTAFGYNLMVGMNAESDGAWNPQDADYFNRILDETQDPQAAHRAAMEVALERIRENPRGVLSLAMRKFESLWKNDDYGVDWVIVSLQQQGRLDAYRQGALERLRRINDWFYAAGLLFSALYGIRLIKRPGSYPAQVLMLLFIGTALLHMVLETQNRYHYFILQAFMILSALNVSAMPGGKEKLWTE